MGAAALRLSLAAPRRGACLAAVNEIVLFALLGLGTGAVIAGLAISVVVTFRGSGIINLATGGAVAMVAAYAFWGFRSGYFHLTLGTPLAVIATIAVAVAVGVLTEFVVFRPLRTSSPLAKLIASLGILLTLQATVLLWFGTSARQVPNLLPRDTVELFGVQIPVNRFWMAGIVVVIGLVLAGCTGGRGSGWRLEQLRRTRSPGCSPASHPTSSRWPTP